MTDISLDPISPLEQTILLPTDCAVDDPSQQPPSQPSEGQPPVVPNPLHNFAKIALFMSSSPNDAETDQPSRKGTPPSTPRPPMPPPPTGLSSMSMHSSGSPMMSIHPVGPNLPPSVTGLSPSPNPVTDETSMTSLTPPGNVLSSALPTDDAISVAALAVDETTTSELNVDDPNLIDPQVSSNDDINSSSNPGSSPALITPSNNNAYILPPPPGSRGTDSLTSQTPFATQWLNMIPLGNPNLLQGLLKNSMPSTNPPGLLPDTNDVADTTDETNGLPDETEDRKPQINDDLTVAETPGANPVDTTSALNPLTNVLDRPMRNAQVNNFFLFQSVLPLPTHYDPNLAPISSLSDPTPNKDTAQQQSSSSQSSTNTPNNTSNNGNNGDTPSAQPFSVIPLDGPVQNVQNLPNMNLDALSNLNKFGSLFSSLEAMSSLSSMGFGGPSAFTALGGLGGAPGLGHFGLGGFNGINPLVNMFPPFIPITPFRPPSKLEVKDIRPKLDQDDEDAEEDDEIDDLFGVSRSRKRKKRHQQRGPRKRRKKHKSTKKEKKQKSEIPMKLDCTIPPGLIMGMGALPQLTPVIGPLPFPGTSILSIQPVSNNSGSSSSSSGASSDGSTPEVKIRTPRRRKKKELPSISCPKCDATFTSQTTLKTHLRSHAGKEEFACEFCGKVFGYKSSLLRHRRIHTGERPYPCKTCHKKFSDSSALFKHQKVHTQERKFQCSSCDKKFGYKHVLERHEKSLHGVVRKTGKRSSHHDTD